MDPLTQQYPWYTPYQFAGNKPIWATDRDGMEEDPSNSGWSGLVKRYQMFFTGLSMPGTSGLPLIKKSVDVSNGYQGPLAGAGQQVVTSVGSTLNGELRGFSLNTYPKDPSAALGGPPALNEDASNVGGWGSMFNTISIPGTPGASLELAPAADGSSGLQSLNQALNIPLTVYSNSQNTNNSNAQDHHIATDKNDVSTARGGPWTPRFQAFFDNAGLNIKTAPENLVSVIDHVGPHPEEYHQLVFDRLNIATKGLKANTPAYKTAVTNTLQLIGKEAQTTGSTVNKLLTGK